LDTPSYIIVADGHGLEWVYWRGQLGFGKVVDLVYWTRPVLFEIGRLKSPILSDKRC